MNPFFMLNKTPLASCLLLSFVLTGCFIFVPTYRELELPDQTFGDIWVAMQHATRDLGYRADRRETDRGRRVFQSTWNTQPKFPRGSVRRRVRAEVERIEPGQPGWRVRCYVEKQRVDTIGRSLNPREEDWAPDGQDLGREEKFVGKLRSWLGLEVIEPTRRPTDQEPARIR